MNEASARLGLSWKPDASPIPYIIADVDQLCASDLRRLQPQNGDILQYVAYFQRRRIALTSPRIGVSVHHDHFILRPASFAVTRAPTSLLIAPCHVAGGHDV